MLDHKGLELSCCHNPMPLDAQVKSCTRGLVNSFEDGQTGLQRPTLPKIGERGVAKRAIHALSERRSRFSRRVTASYVDLSQ